MADNVVITENANSTPPGGTTIAADDVSGVMYQRVKLDGGGDGVGLPVTAGQKTATNSLPVVLASDGNGATQDYRLAVQRGLISGVTVLQSFGERTSMGTTVTGEDIWRGTVTTIPTPPAAGEQMTLVSANDADNGATATGVLTLELHYLDASGAEQTETITMNGTTPVNTAATDIRFVQFMHTLTVGSNGVAEGDISIYQVGSSSTIYCLIAQGGNQSMVTNRMVPAGKTFYLMGWHATESKNKRVAYRIRSTDRDGVLLPGVFCFKDASYLSLSASGEISVNASVPALSVVKVSGWPDQVGAEGSASYWGYLVDD